MFSRFARQAFAPAKSSAIARALLLAALVPMLSLSAAAQQDVHAALVARTRRTAAPEFHLVDEDGKSLQVSDFRGKVVLLNFWATSCGGCILEIPSFIGLQQEYANQGFTAAGISADIPYEGLKSADEAWQRVRPFIIKHHVNYPILMGNDAVIDAYGFKSYPATYLLDKSGHVAATYVGVVSKDDVDANVKKLLAETR